ncbi:MAG TPA: OmpA family protein [Puia sp.]|nr:OmpA family protein [Puia sp.]
MPSTRDTATHITPTPAAKTDTLILRNIQFEFDRYLVDNPDTLLRYKQFLTQSNIKKIRVVGFTDDKGSESYNQQLSEKRAQEVARLLTTRFGIRASIIESEGRGISHDFKDSNLNRRVEIYIFH